MRLTDKERALLKTVSQQSAPTLTEIEWRKALEESLRLQSHYAALLNMHDGGKRIGFRSAEEWIARLKETGSL